MNDYQKQMIKITYKKAKESMSSDYIKGFEDMLWIIGEINLLDELQAS